MPSSEKGEMDGPVKEDENELSLPQDTNVETQEESIIKEEMCGRWKGDPDEEILYCWKYGKCATISNMAGVYFRARVMLDKTSAPSLIAENLARRLGFSESDWKFKEDDVVPICPIGIEIIGRIPDVMIAFNPCRMVIDSFYVLRTEELEVVLGRWLMHDYQFSFKEDGFNILKPMGVERVLHPLCCCDKTRDLIAKVVECDPTKPLPTTLLHQLKRM